MEGTRMHADTRRASDSNGPGPERPAAPVGGGGELLSGVERIAVLRAGGLGDLLFSLPAMRALSAAYPEAEITLLGSAAAVLLQERSGAPHRVVQLPRVPGLNAPPAIEVADGTISDFLAEQRDEAYDLAVQLHGGGRYSNSFLLAIEAGCTIGTRTPDAAVLDRSIDYVYYQHEMIRGLEVAGLVGAPPVELEPSIEPRSEELAAARSRFGAERPIVALHPGATDPRRRWPAERFARVAAELARDGLRVVIVGDGGERELCRSIAFVASEALAKDRSDLVVDASGSLTLPELAGVLGAARLMIGNDSGPRHLAQAVGTPTASVYWFGNLINAGPLERGRHRVQIAWTTHCPVCGRDCTQVGWTSERCEHDVSFVSEVTSDAVLDDAYRLLETAEAAA